MTARSSLGLVVDRRNGLPQSPEQIDAMSAEAWRRPLDPDEERYLIIRINGIRGNPMLKDAAIAVGDLVHGKAGA
jgi:hypothetical protein